MDTRHDTGLSALAAGVAGAVALNAAHQLGQRVFDDAPRMDVVAMRATRRIHTAAGAAVPDAQTLFIQTLLGDLAANATYYSLVGAGSREGRWWRGAALGIGAGVGALTIPNPLGLGDPPHSRQVRNRVLTIAWYTIGGLVAAAALDVLDPVAVR